MKSKASDLKLCLDLNHGCEIFLSLSFYFLGFADTLFPKSKWPVKAMPKSIAIHILSQSTFTIFITIQTFFSHFCHFLHCCISTSSEAFNLLRITKDIRNNFVFSLLDLMFALFQNSFALSINFKTAIVYKISIQIINQKQQIYN